MNKSRHIGRLTTILRAFKGGRMKDILFKDEELVFSYRVGGVLKKGDKILLQRQNADYAIIGGHVNALETSKQTLIREFKEELRADVKIGNLFAIGEIFFDWGNRACHQISLYYNVSLIDESQIPTSGIFYGFDEAGCKRIDLDYCWIPLCDLENITLYPQELIPYILSNPQTPIHFVSKQLKN